MHIVSSQVCLNSNLFFWDFSNCQIFVRKCFRGPCGSNLSRLNSHLLFLPAYRNTCYLPWENLYLFLMSSIHSTICVYHILHIYFFMNKEKSEQNICFSLSEHGGIACFGVQNFLFSSIYKYTLLKQQNKHHPQQLLSWDHFQLYPMGTINATGH